MTVQNSYDIRAGESAESVAFGLMQTIVFSQGIRNWKKEDILNLYKECYDTVRGDSSVEVSG